MIMNDLIALRKEKPHIAASSKQGSGYITRGNVWFSGNSYPHFPLENVLKAVHIDNFAVQTVAASA